MSDHSDIKAHVRVYMMVFAALGVLTVVTVGAKYIHLPIGPAVALALAIATFKASLVALYFMHLKGEVKTIVWVLALTGLFFAFLVLIPLGTFGDHLGTPHASAKAPTEDAGHH